METTRRIREACPPVEVWFARGDPMSAGSPFAMLGQAIRRAAGVLEGERRDVRWQRLCERIGRHVVAAETPRVAELIGELCGVTRVDPRAPRPSMARRDPVLLGDQMRRAWEDWLAAECAARPSCSSSKTSSGAISPP